MERKRKLFVAKAAVVLGVIPVLLWAHEYGPDAGYSGVPKENGTCAQLGCHVGTTNDPSNHGSVAVTFPNGATYTPGVKQHLVVTIADPATTQRAWGFQLTARTASNSNTLAGTFASTDPNTLLMCAPSSFFSELQVDYAAGKTQTCPSSMPLQYIEHSLAGYTATRGQTGSGTFQFDWTPPSTSVGNIVFYVAGNAANGDLTVNGDHIYATTFTVTPAAASTKPAISANGVVNGASFVAGIVPGSFASIFGTNLASTTTGKDWAGSITNGQLPTQIDGVSVSVGGKPAYIAYIRQDQINIQVPDAGVGPMQVTITNSGGTSDPVTVTSQQFGPAFFLTGGKYAVAQHYPDYGYSANPSVVPGAVAAKPGDILILWGAGFGPTNPAVPAGEVPPPTGPSVTGGGVSVAVTVGGVNARLISAVLSPYAADYQIAIQLPSTLPNGDVPIKASICSYQSPDNVYIYVQN